MKDDKKLPVPALEKAARVLQYLSGRTEGSTLTDICRDTNLPKSSAFSLLLTLEELGYIQKTGNVYLLGVRLYTLGCRALEHVVSAKRYRPALVALRDKTRFTVHFCTYENGKLTVLDKLDGFGVVQFKAYKGQRKRLNTSAGGKALAAFLPDEELKNVLAAGFDRFTPTSIANAQDFLAHLEDIRRVGYSIDEGEGETGVRCLGAPVFMDGGRVFGGVSLTTISPLLPLVEIPHYAALLLQTAAEISRSLSYAGPYPLPQCDPTLPHPYVEQIEAMQPQENAEHGPFTPGSYD